MRITWNSDINTPISNALNSSDLRYSPQYGAVAPMKAK